MSTLNDVLAELTSFDIGESPELSKSYTGMPSGVSSGAETKLSPDDDNVSQQLSPRGPKTTLGSGAGSGDGGGLGGATRDSGVRKSDDAALYPVSFQGAGQTVWSQGSDAKVLYSSIEDGLIAKAMEDGTLSPEMGAPTHSPLYGLRKCSTCGCGFNKAITVCPSCSTDALSGQHYGGQGLSMSKSVRDSITPPVYTDVFPTE